MRGVMGLQGGGRMEIAAGSTHETGRLMTRRKCRRYNGLSLLLSGDQHLRSCKISARWQNAERFDRRAG